jgi:hypothetical protein
MCNRALIGVLLVGATACLLVAATAVAQGPTAPTPGLRLGSERVLPPLVTEGPWGSTIGLEFFNRLRGEFVDWFATPPNQSNSTFRYDFIGNKFQLGLRVRRAPYELFVQFQDSTISNLPRNGVGVGSIYYANTMRPLQNGAILRNAWASSRELFGVSGLVVKAGRQLYSNAVEATAKDPNLAWLQYNRLSQRLIGPFDYTHIGRSFDGGQLGYDAAQWNATAFGFKPTYGGYEVDANRELDINLAGGALSLKELAGFGTTVGQLAYYYYDDFRDVVFLDNRPLAVRQAEQGRPANIHTLGAYLVHTLALGPGAIDALAYGYGQFGDWQSQTQSAWAYGVETGYRLTDVWARPWLRVGINSASGDTNPNDDTHGTFFQLLPTAWLYAQFPFYNMMNNQDVLAQCIVDPHPRVSLRVDFHWLRVNTSNDFVYFGGGATKNDFFGYGGTPTGGRNELAYLTHFMLTTRATQNLVFNFFYAHAWGQGIINSAFVGRGGNYGFIETVLSF